MRKIAPMPKMLCKHFRARSPEREFTALRQIRFNKVASKIRTPLYTSRAFANDPPNSLRNPARQNLGAAPKLLKALGKFGKTAFVDPSKPIYSFGNTDACP